MTARLFAYGTLQPGRLRWPSLEPYVGGHRPAHVCGRIYDGGAGWPVMVFEDAATPVPGTILDLDRRRLREILRVLDDVESAATELLTRIVVTTTEGETAWAYHWIGSTSGMTPIKRWVATVER
ncbi:MAG: gamma-glutamylcyclotransferase family protein [Ilumatobacteraceae bacterium]